MGSATTDIEAFQEIGIEDIIDYLLMQLPAGRSIFTRLEIVDLLLDLRNEHS